MMKFNSWHLYLGCEVIWKDESYRMVSTSYSGLIGIAKGLDESVYLLPDEECKLILRPLSDMSEEEMCQVIKLHADDESHNSYKFVAPHYIDFDYYNNGELYPSQLSLECINAEILLFLLSKGFDLFNLIPQGLAIDATTLKQQ